MGNIDLDMNLVRQAQREGRLEQMWWMLQSISESDRIDLCLSALRFIQGLQPFDLEHSLTVFDRLGGMSSPDVRRALMETMGRLASHETAARSTLFERLLQYSRSWDQQGRKIGASVSTRISGLWKKFSLVEKIILHALSRSLGGAGVERRPLHDIAHCLDIFKALLPEVELRLKLDSFVESGLLVRDAEGRYGFAEGEDRRYIEHGGDYLELICRHREQFLGLLSLENFQDLRQAMKRNKRIPMARWLECFGLDSYAWKKRETFIQNMQAWRRAVLNNQTTREVARAADAVVEDLAQRIHLEVSETGRTDDFLYYAGRKLGLRNPKLSRLALLLPRGPGRDGASIKRLEEWIYRESHSQQIFIMLSGRPDRSDMRAVAEDSANDIVVFEEKNLIRLTFAADPDRVFMDMVVEGCDLESLSPYEAQAPVREMFYGREGLVKEILRSRKGYALVGTRRMGKTSLLFRLQDELKQRPRSETVFLECGGVSDALSLAERLAQALKLNLPPAFQLPDFERSLRRWLDASSRYLYCFFDEIDDLVAAGKEAEPLWQIFKSLSFEGRMTIYVAGFSELFSRYRDYESLFFNFLIMRQLSALDQKSASALLAHPLRELGLRFEDPQTRIASILEKTSTHPNIIQIFCDLLVKRMARIKRRRITDHDVEEVARHPDFEEQIIRIMHSNLIRPVEKLLLLLVAYYNLRPLSLPQVADLLADWDVRIPIDEVEKILERLVLYGVFEEREGQFDFSHPYFATILRHRDVESLITYYCDEVSKKLGISSPQKQPL